MQNSIDAESSQLRSQHPNFQSNARPERVEDRAKHTLAQMEQRRAQALTLWHRSWTKCTRLQPCKGQD